MSRSGMIEILRSFDVAQAMPPAKQPSVIPAKAGIHLPLVRRQKTWIPASAGMTEGKSTSSRKIHNLSD